MLSSNLTSTPSAALACVLVSLGLHAAVLGAVIIDRWRPAPHAVGESRAAERSISIEAFAASAAPDPGVPVDAPRSGAPEALGAPPPRAAADVPKPARSPAERLRSPSARRPLVAPERRPEVAPVSAAVDAPAGGTTSGMEAASGVGLPSAGGGTAMAPAREGGPGAANGVPEGPARAALLTRYLTAARDRIRRHREYPYLARRAQLEGTVCLRISVAASGGVVGVTPTCGQTPLPLLRAALKAVTAAAPFAPVPPALGMRLTFEVPVVFELAEL